MATIIRISGVDIKRLKNSIRISDMIESRSTASFIVVDETGVGTYTRGQTVEIITDLPIPPFAHLLFSGYIYSAEKKRISPSSNALYWLIQCMDNHYLADKRVAAESYTGQTAGFIVDALLTKYLAPEGITAGAIQTGPTIAEMVINYQSISKAFDALAEKSNFIWQIDKFKQLFFVERTTYSAPFNIDSGDIIRDSGMSSSLAESSPLYRNRQFVRAGRDLTSLQTENFTGDGILVAFTMGYPIAKVPTITVGGAPIVNIGIKGIDELEDVYWNKGDATITFSVAPLLGQAIVCQYYGLFDILVQADDVLEQAARKAIEGGTGLVETIDDEPNITNRDDAFDAALAKLERYGIIGRQFNFPIRQWGLEPGQMVTINYPEYGLAGDFLVESLSINEVAPEELRYTIKAIEGPELGDWTRFFKALADMKSEVMEKIVIGKDQILIILARTDENWEWDELVTEAVFACPIPSVTLFPSVSLYPC